MKSLGFLLILSFPVMAYSQIVTEEDFQLKVKSIQEQCIGAHQSVVQRANEDFAGYIWGTKIRFNNAGIIRFFNHSAGEEVSAGVDVTGSSPGGWVYTFDQGTATNLFKENGVRVTRSYNTSWISARQELLYAESERDGKKTGLELYCPRQSFFELLRIGQVQSIEFLITGYKGNVSSGGKIYGILTQVNAEKQVVKCSNGHEFDQSLGYKFCPECGEALK